ncbi:MAG: mRNA binding protein puf3 [Bathelium mastoideum]|nr:MAG: mRNA binding protein puf3 [Bathelium mastoideum]
MSSGLVGRQGIPSQTNMQSRFGDLGNSSTRSTGEGVPASRGTLGTGFGARHTSYGSNIWSSSSTFGSTFGSSTRDSSRTREGGSLLSPQAEELPSKRGSGALVSSSESDDWAPPWTNRDTHSSSRSASQVRANGVSPVRQRSNNGFSASQSHQNSSLFTQTNLTSAVGQVPTRSTLENNAAGFQSNRSASSFSGPSFGNTNSYLDAEMRRAAEQALSSWPDTTAFHSSPDDKSSPHGSDYYSNSGFASRDGSLPPSRHGRDAMTIPTYRDSSQRSHQSQPSFGVPRHVPSLSSQQTNGGAYNDRPVSQGLDLAAEVARLSLPYSEQPANSQRPMFNSVSEFPQQMPSFNERSLDQSRSFTPSRNLNLRAMNSRERQGQGPTTNGDYHHQHSYYSADSTPPRPYGPAGFANGDPRVITSNQFAFLHDRLNGAEQEQNRSRTIPQSRTVPYVDPYAQSFLYGPSQMLPGVNGSAPLMQMQFPGMMPWPKGPREHDVGHGMRSALLDEFKTNQKTKRYELKDIYDHIVEFSGDQHGSRFIQTKLETANSDEKDRVFREIHPNAPQLMSDVFGNYVIQKFFEHGDQTQKKILAGKMKGQVFTLSTQMYACRVVQKALEHVLTDQQASIVKELEPRVMDCVKDQNGNHVIQKAIERVPAEHMHFIVNAFAGKVQDLSIHPYGCRVIQRMLEHCEPHIKRSVLQEIQSCEATLIPDQYGNYVTQHAIELGTDEDRARVYELIKGQLLAFSKHKYASNVVEAVLKHATDPQRREIMNILTEKNEKGDSHLVMMIKDGFANYVIQRLLDTLEKSDYIAFMEVLQPELVKAKRIASGKQVQAVSLNVPSQQTFFAQYKKHKLSLKVAKIEHKMHRLESNHAFGLNIPTPPSISTNISAATTPPPPLTGSGQSPQSSSLPSANTSTIDDPVQTINGGKPTIVHEVGIAS